MNGEKVKEIKKALQDHSIEKLKYQDGIKIKEIDFIDILTLINGLENENEWLRLERDVLIGKKIVEKQKYDNALMVKIDIQKQLKDRLAELEDKIANGTLVEIDKSLIGQGIIGIHHYTDGTYQLDWDENIIIGFSSDGVITWNSAHCYNDEFRNGMFFMDNEKGKSEAEARLKELQEEQK